MLCSAPAMRTVSSRQNPLVRTFRELSRGAQDDGRMLLDGEHLLREAAGAGIAIETVALTHAQLDATDTLSPLINSLGAAGTDVVLVSDAVMGALSPVKSPSGPVAIAPRPRATPEAICARPGALIIVAVDVQDPGNLGALLRAAEAGGATGALVCGTSAHPYSWKALRGSMGSVLRLPTATASVNDMLSLAAHHGVRTIATTPRSGRSPADLDWKAATAVLVGGEGQGLDNALVERCSERVTIPMSAPVESLNVAVAGALLIYEARRQRT